MSAFGRSIKSMRKLRTLNEVTESYFREHPEEIDDYLTEIFQDFTQDNDTGVLLASLRVLDRCLMLNCPYFSSLLNKDGDRSTSN
jgi:hypothetical protein